MDIVVDSSRVTQLAELWRQTPDITREEMLRTITECDLLVQGELMQRLPHGAGGLHGAGVASTVFREEHVLTDNVLGLVASNKPYAEYLEVGTKPHRVNEQGVKSLADWAHARLGYNEKEAVDVANAIAWKIRRHGTEANPVWQTTYVRLQGKILAKFSDAVVRIVSRMTGAMQ